MKNIRNVLFQLIIMLVTFSTANSQSLKKIVGNWSGKIAVSNMELEIIFKISEDETGKLSAKMDVPMQGAKDLPVGEIIASTDSLILKIPMIPGTYKGEIKTGEKIEGEWQQGGIKVPLILEKTEKVTKLNRPQTPQRPFPYVEEEVEYFNKKSGLLFG